MTERPTAHRRSITQVMHWDASLPADVVERLWREPLRLLAEGAPLHEKPSCTVVRIMGAQGSWVLKHYTGGGWRRWRRAVWGRSTARKAWTDGRFLHQGGVPTPQPRACLEQRVGPATTSCFFLADYVPGETLYRVMRYKRPDESTVHSLARQAAAIWQRLDELSACHNDFKAENLLVDADGKLWLIDLDRLLRIGRREVLCRRQARDAADLLHKRSWRRCPQAAEAFRLALLQTQAGAEAVAACGGDHPLARPAAPDHDGAHLVTALIPCRNAESTIVACLESLRDVADEIIVADAGSTDRTVRLASEFGACRVIQRRGPRNEAFERWAHAAASHPWILRVMPDERVNPELGRQVQDATAKDDAPGGFRIGRAVYFQGQRLRHGLQHEPELRLYRRDAVDFAPRAGRVEPVLRWGRPQELASRLLWEAWPSLAEAAAVEPGRGAWRQAWRFFKTYVLRRGFLDGAAGLRAAYWSALVGEERASDADASAEGHVHRRAA